MRVSDDMISIQQIMLNSLVGMDRHILKCLPFLHILSLIGPLLCYSIGEMPSLLLLDGHHYHFVSILFSLKNESYFASHITSARKYIIFLLVHVPVGRYTVHVHHMKILLLALDHTLYGTSTVFIHVGAFCSFTIK